MKFNFKNIFLGVLLLIIFMIGCEVGKNTSKIENKPISDTIYKLVVDTIYQDTGSVKFKDKPYPVPYYVELIGEVDSLALKQAYAIRKYNEIYEDSTIKITVKDSILGYLMKQGVSYQMKGIKQINTVKSTTITNSVNVPTPMKYQVSLGLQASPKGLMFGGDLTIKRSQYGLMYDPFNKVPYIAYKYIIFRK